MRWQFVDRIISYEKWKSIQGIKMVSLEEYHLLSRFGRKGFLPETLALESCVEISRWLIMKSSDFKNSCIISGITDFCFRGNISMGDILMMLVKTKGNHFLKAKCECRIQIAGKEAAQGNIDFQLASLQDFYDPLLTATMWDELYAAS